jgi:beta-mannosidase
MNRTALHDGWTLRFLGGPVPAGIPGVIPATVPGTVHTDLLAEDLIPDPYLDLNEAEVQWIGQTDVQYDTVFDFVRGGHERVDLVCEGLDTIATLELNGIPLGTTRNQHRSYRFDLREALRESDNQLSVKFDSALDYAYEAEQRIGKRPFVGNSYPYNAIRKMASNFGWDWGPVLVTAGIVKPISIQTWSTARLSSVRPVVTVGAGTVGNIELHIEVERTSDVGVSLEARVLDARGRQVASVIQDLTENSTVLALAVDEPELWWPRGYGEQPLYEIVLALRADGRELDSWTKGVGFRTVKVEIAPDEFGTSFSFHVNGQYVYIKGANWIPDDCFLPRVTPERYARSITDATDAGMNLLRVWGGGIYESDAFYDVCDREGLLVWQDFALACAAYSEAPELWDEIEAEARENVTRLASHPSLVIWNGGNENVEGFYHWGWREALAADEPWGNGYYEQLLPSILSDLDPTRAYIPSSPFNPADPTKPRDTDNGPVHEWDVWNRKDYTHYRASIPRFVAEFGFQGPPAFSTIERSMHDDPLASDSPAVISHQKAEDGNDKLQWGLGTHLPHPVGFDDWHFATQLNQARAITYGIEHFRSHSPRTAGSIIWQLNDCWPVSSWAAVDGDKRRKPLWYALRAVNAERLMTFQPRDGGLALIVSNDSSGTWSETIEVRRHSLDGNRRASQTIVVDVAPRSNATVIIESGVAQSDSSLDELLVADSLFARRTLWFFAEDPELRMPELDIATRVTEVAGGYAVEITANAFVKDLVFNADRLDPVASVDELFITLLPGETKTVTIQTTRKLDVEAITSHPILASVNSLLSRSAANRLASL